MGGLAHPDGLYVNKQSTDRVAGDTLVLRDGDTTGKAIDKDSGLLSVSSNSNIDAPRSFGNQGDEVKERYINEGPD